MPIVSCQLSVVSCGGASVANLIRVCGAAYGFEIAVQLRPQLIDPRFQCIHIFAFQKSATVSSSQKMLRFIKRTTGSADKASVISIAPSPLPFGNVCSHAVRSAYQLRPHGIPGEG